MTRTVAWAMVWLAAATAAHAQQFTGSLRGAVHDANGVLRGVTVILTNDTTGFIREAVTNDAGEYAFAAVTPGAYTVGTSIAGYKTFERHGLRLATQQIATLDIALDVGAIQESVTVTSESPQVETSSASQGVTLDRETLTALPSPGRNAFLMAVIVPTVNPVGDPQFNRQQDQTNASRIAIGGGGIRANNYLVDGVPITDLAGRAVLNPTIEALEDIRVQIHTYDAETGRTGGGVFNVTARSGTNQYRGTGFIQTRPVWGQALNFFNEVAGATKESTGLSDSFYWLWGGGVGGPIRANRTFFWSAVEGYRSRTTRNLQRLWPSLRQRNGDFSGTTLNGQPVRIFNPWCRGGVVNPRCPATGTGSLETGGEFLSAIIPRNHPAANAVGFNLLNQWPDHTNLGDPMRENENGDPNVITTASIVDEADMWTLKIDHKVSDRWLVSGLYVYNNTDEPGSTSMPSSQTFMDSDYFVFQRRPHVLVFNDSHILNDTTVLTLRYGWTTWRDELAKTPFSAGLESLGFSQTYTNSIHADGRDTFPGLVFDEVNAAGFQGGTRRRWKSPYAVNGAFSKLWDTHNVKVGADLRQLGVSATTESAMSGIFAFNRLFTSAVGVPGSGHELASLLLGLPAGGQMPVNRGDGEWFTRYTAAYFQDDWRMTPRVTVNYGARLEHEDGLRELHNRQTVAFDRNAINPLDALVPKIGTALEGRTLRGGLVYAGANGSPDAQGDLPAVTISPRTGIAMTLDANTVLRGGYGLFVAPWQYTSNARGQTGFAQTTFVSQSAADRDVPSTTLDNPFPAGLQQPLGGSLGPLTGVGGTVEFIDQDKGASRIHQYSVDVQRQLAGRMAVTIGYTGATGRDIGFGGTNSVAININQIDPDLARRLFPAPGGRWNVDALREQVPNPFFGIAEAGPLATATTIARGQLLRPFPQFGDINMRETTAGGRRQYHAMIVTLDKRIDARGWGGRLTYTWSSTRDNQFGETSVFGASTPTPQNNHDLDAEYGVSNVDSPHHIVLAPVVRIPERGPGSRFFGGWMISAIAELVSGPPLNATLSGGLSGSNLGLGGGQQRPNLVGSPNTPGGDDERVATAIDPGARWFDRTAFEDPGPGRFGTSPRTYGGARYQFRKNVDIAISKDIRLGGSQTAEIRAEILNLTNTPKFGGAPNAVDLSSFGRVTDQLGFSRLWQLSFRYRF
jgi:hypothetical protein